EITPYENDYVSGSDVTNLEIHLNSTYYAESDAAPSFMMRFEGDLNSSEYGIESLVDKQEVGTYFPCPAGTTNTDYLYWQCSSVNTWGVTGMPSWFYLDNQTVDSEGRLEKYEVEGLV
ncbi:MAG: hypothetical protein ACE5DM_06030, partial [Candidatus Nanoarchaeia archaeon]